MKITILLLSAFLIGPFTRLLAQSNYYEVFSNSNWHVEFVNHDKIGSWDDRFTARPIVEQVVDELALIFNSEAKIYVKVHLVNFAVWSDGDYDGSIAVTKHIGTYPGRKLKNIAKHNAGKVLSSARYPYSMANMFAEQTLDGYGEYF